jgi:hypothetical protein
MEFDWLPLRAVISLDSGMCNRKARPLFEDIAYCRNTILRHNENLYRNKELLLVDNVMWWCLYEELS